MENSRSVNEEAGEGYLRREPLPWSHPLERRRFAVECDCMAKAGWNETRAQENGRTEPNTRRKIV